jgi:hypothetical protein
MKNLWELQCFTLAIRFKLPFILISYQSCPEKKSWWREDARAIALITRKAMRINTCNTIATSRRRKSANKCQSTRAYRMRKVKWT